MAKAERQSNIELLRILAIMGVIVLHYNNPIIGGGITYAEEGSVNFYLLCFMESLFACEVNLFMLISGYFMCESGKRNLWRPVELIVQVIIFRELVYLARVALGAAAFSVKTVFTTLISANYFVILYCAVFILSPFVNSLISRLSEKNFRTLMALSFGVFAIIPTGIDVLGELRGEQFVGLSTVGMYGSQWGYTIVNFMLMYLIGAYLRKGKSRMMNWASWKLGLLLLVDILVIVIWARVNDKTGYFTERSAWEYCNLLIIGVAVLVFILFSRIKLGVNKAINMLAEGAFTVFLLHNVFIPYLQIERFVKGNTFVMILHILGCAVGLYLLCWCVHKVYHLITDPMFRKLSDKHKGFMLAIEP